jgi:hypothetical protein
LDDREKAKFSMEEEEKNMEDTGKYVGEKT